MSDWREFLNIGEFERAEPLMLAATEAPDGYGGETIVRAHFYESWGDSLGKSPEAERKYWESHRHWATFASWATSGGEGTARMMDVNRVLRKIEQLGLNRDQ